MSRIPEFYKLSPKERMEKVKSITKLTDEETALIQSVNGLKLEQADKMVENVIGAMPIPLGIAVNFLINGKDYLIPMATEEPSVIAAASNAAKMARIKGGFTTSSTEPIMFGQIQVVDVKNPPKAKKAILAAKKEILEKANAQDPTLVLHEGGAKDLDVKILKTISGQMVIVNLHVDCRDAMGANAVNSMAEAVAPLLERITGGKVYLRIISNLATARLARAEAVFAKEALGGEEVVNGIIKAYAFASSDPFRAATHNKGIMNGITAVVLATGNDTRAIEAGAHAYAAITGKYKPLTIWEKNKNKDLVGKIELPMAVGLIGGATAVHPVAKASIKILGVKTARELAEVIVAVGLAQNLAALKALITEGIQRGHMRLHARNIAATAGATGILVDKVAERMIEEHKIKIDRAKELIEELKEKQ
ncbi:MAG TPA: hydroxymethylglutaryl-CoA reductase, degradative [archaeon]|nr:hydroxymethylglutaryl-CoA reductase, degradative [archaeon]